MPDPKPEPTPETRRYRFVGAHAEDLAGGQQIVPGEFVDLDENGERGNEQMIRGGALILAPEPEPDAGSEDTEAEPTKPRSNRKPTTTKEG